MTIGLGCSVNWINSISGQLGYYPASPLEWRSIQYWKGLLTNMSEFTKCVVAIKKCFRSACLLSFIFIPACDVHDHKVIHSPEPVEKSQLSGVTTNGHYTVAISTADNSPAPVGRYHDWIISVEHRESGPVQQAAISIGGGMPAHGHGLPTNPKVSEYLGNGRYLLEGMKFTMDGNWLIQIHIVSKGIQDAIEFSYPVSY